ncbi:GIY-YIG nuclease family protein [Actinomycetospora termitidis]|uniref:GIY-YIG catalytic domain-containing protein n=1 Tax=Actinomycetospora termitidis TaxID=3053470 RepID=A0ABT7MGE7_9PSEU|nr:hypothetical protein [Actinomycetospora sp. Odt1-22]MDL5159753.1 hypothetical protein [Actinomycetospora sp. Odt1-22]
MAETLLGNTPVTPGVLAEQVPRGPGLYAWWASPSVLSGFDGAAHASEPDLRLLYVGLATNLRSRLHGNHMRRSGTSTLRRTLAGLLLDEHGFRTRRTDRVVLVDEDEVRLSAWMTEHLRVTWCTHPEPGAVEAEVIRLLRPPLNVDHASGPARDLVRAARARYRSSA